MIAIDALEREYGFGRAKFLEISTMNAVFFGGPPCA
jgi:hypothetical protein